MSGNNKSGYSIRTDLLGMAIGIVESRVARLDQNQYLKPEGMRNAVNPYTTEDILVEAEKLYQFVQNNGQ
jgi:hypothetical protein